MNALEGRWRSSLRDLQEKEAYLEGQFQALRQRYAGLKDIDLTLQLITTKLTIAIRVLDLIRNDGEGGSEEMGAIAKKCAVEGVELLEGLASDKVSLDQKELILEAEEYQAALDLFHHLILEGGAPFFESRIEDRRHATLVAGIITDAIRKYAPSDSDYEAVFRPERLPPVLRRIVNRFFPIFFPENRQGPPMGIDEGQQIIYHAERIRMPLSQAINYYEEELLPSLTSQLRESPGDQRLQREIEQVERIVRDYKELRFVPRSTPGSTPIIVGKDFYTHSITEFTADGELMVSVELPVSFSSGSNLERMQELVQGEVARRLAGKGVCPELDEQYRHLKSLDSGIRGSSRIPSFRLDLRAGFSALKRTFPVMRRLENKNEFSRLLSLVAAGDAGKVRRLLTQFIMTGEERHRELE